MGILTLVIIVIALYVAYIVIRNKNASKKILENGKKYVHSSFPDLPGVQRFKTFIAGAHHYNQKFTPAVNNCLLLKREPDNPYDENAVGVKTLLDEKVGHIPAERAEVLAEGMDNGRQFYALVDKIEESKADQLKNHYVISVHEISKADQTIAQ